MTGLQAHEVHIALMDGPATVAAILNHPECVGLGLRDVLQALRELLTDGTVTAVAPGVYKLKG